MYVRKLFTYLSLLLLVLFPARFFGQSPNGSIDGVITDISNATVPNASVTLLNPATGATRLVHSDDSGFYTFAALPPGVYTVTVEQSGFRKQVRSDITLQVQQIARINFSLSVGQASEVIDVVASAPLLSSDDATVGQVIDNRRIVELPLNGRNYLQLAALSPGVTTSSAPSGGATGFQGGQRAAQSITVNGQRNDFNHYTLDGIENTDPNFNTYILLPSLDALQEFKVQTATYPAEFGFSISQINVSTKSGTNQIHGSAFEFLRNSWVDAKNFFDAPGAHIPAFRRNQFGGAVGGPILKDRLFFFANYEGLREGKALTAISTVPSAAMLSGTFTGGNTIYDPATRVVASNGTVTATPFYNNVIPQNRISPVALAALQYYSAPNLPGTSRNYINTESRTSISDQSLLRIDYQMSDRFSWVGRWNYDKDSQYLPGAFPKEGSVVATRPDQVMVGGTQIFGSTLVNEVRFGWTRFVNNNVGYNSSKTDINGQVLKIPGLNSTSNPAFFGIPTFGFVGYSGFGEPSTVYLTHNNVWELHDTLSWTHGNHFVKFGGAYQPIHYNQTGNQFARGGFNFDGSVTRNPAVVGSVGNEVADFLLGYPVQTQNGVQAANAALRGTYFALFATDLFHLRSNLTLEYGLRYESLAPFRDINDASANITDVNTSSPVLVRASNKGKNLDPYEGLIVRLQGVNLVRDGRLGPSLVQADRNNFAPRLGLSYTPDDKTVFRAGFGTFYDVLDMGNSVYDMARTLAGLLRVDQNATIPDVTFANPFRSSGANGSTINLVQPLILANAPDMRNAYVNEWTLDVQRALSANTMLDIGYVGSQGHRLKKMTSLNMPTPGPGSVAPRRPWQQFGYVQYANSIGNSNYNGLQIKLERHFSHGLTLLSAYTFSKSLDNTSGVRPGSGDVLTPNNPSDLGRGERGLSSFDVRHRWVTSGLVESPFGKGNHYNSNRLLNAVLGSWQLGGIFTAESGTPTTPVDGRDIPNISTGATPRPNVTGISPVLSHPTYTRFFNPAAFAMNAPYTFGNARRNSIIGPRLVDLDMSLMRSIPLGERVVSELRWDVFNVANHPILGLPNATLSSPAYASISSTRVDSRQMQLSVRIVF